VDGNAQSHDLQQWALQRRTVHFWYRKAFHFPKEPGRGWSRKNGHQQRTGYIKRKNLQLGVWKWGMPPIWP
jgi:hypothetical protein